MSKKTAILFSCSDHYAHRVFAVDAALKSLGFQTRYVTSDFDHTGKARFRCTVDGCVQLPVRAYRKNLSVSRILSHREFAKKAVRYLLALPQPPEVVYAVVPPNFLAHELSKYRKKHPNTKLIFDIFDLWPETFPSGRMKKLLAPVFAVWARLRDRSLPRADFVITECELFRQTLMLESARSRTVYLCAEPLSRISRSAPPIVQGIALCYLGAINNIIDIPAICALVRTLAERRSVTLHIVGKGERQQEFVDAAKAAGADVVFHGAVYDEAQKQEILGKCHFGLNIMKSSVCVGLTMKSVDYLRYGLPIINSIGADTRRLVERDGIGVNLDENAVQTLLELPQNGYAQMEQSARRVFAREFARGVADEQLRRVFDDLGFSDKKETH